jgi:hypothetical protein
VPCKSCQSTNQRLFESEINIHFPELKNVRRSPVIAFPDLVICLNCGFTETKIGDSELQELVEDRDHSPDAG